MLLERVALLTIVLSEAEIQLASNTQRRRNVWCAHLGTVTKVNRQRHPEVARSHFCVITCKHLDHGGVTCSQALITPPTSRGLMKPLTDLVRSVGSEDRGLDELNLHRLFSESDVLFDSRGRNSIRSKAGAHLP
jgi:hypothetical protein